MKDFTMDPGTKNCCVKGSFRTDNSSIWRTNWKGSLAFAFFTCILLFLPFNQVLAQNIQGIAPTVTPPGGFEIDGNAYAQTAGDWESDLANEAAGLFLSTLTPDDFDNGNPEFLFDAQYRETSFFYRDDISNNDPTIFTGSNKIDDDPTTYTWGSGSSPNKNEIQTVAVHFTNGDPTHPNGSNTSEDDLWIVFAADRQVTNGSSYIDFELLQNSLTLTGMEAGEGGFASEGPDGGRTIGDLLITIEFTVGGDQANVVIRQWQAANGGFEYVLFNEYAENTIFGTVNTEETEVPWSVYFTDPLASGLYMYEINQWAEGAVNLSYYFDSDDPCFSISTMFVRTRTSGSSGTSELKDFPRLEQLEINLTPEISFDDPEPVCSPETVDLTDIVVAGCDDGTLSYWMDEDFQTAVPDETAVGDGTYYIKCTSNASEECFDIQPVTVTVNPLPEVIAGNSGPVCYDVESVSLSETGGDAISWAWSSDGAAVFSDASAQNPTVTGFVDGEIFTVEVTDANGCMDSDSTTLTVYPEPTAVAENSGPVCYDATSVSLNETGGDAVSWSWSSDGAAVFSDASAQNPTVTGFVDGEIFTVNIVDENDCTSSDSTTLSVYLEPTAVAENSGPVCYDEASVSLNETGGDAVSWGWSSDGAAVFSDASAQNPTVTGFADGEIFTVMITDENDCTSSDTTTLTVYPEPTAVAGNSGPVCYDEASVSLSESGGDAVSWAWSSDGAAVFSDASAQNPTVTGFADGEIFTVMITDENDCTSSDTTTLTVYPEPSCSASNSGPVCAGDDVMLFESGGDAVSWMWSSNGAATFNDNTLQNPTASGAVDGEIFTVMITDANDCTSTCTTTVTVEVCAQEGCTLGYWKNHTDRWCDAYSTCDLYGDVFANAPSELADLSLLDVLNLGGGGIYNLGRQSVAALLNACSPDVQFYLSSTGQVIDYVNAAFLAGDYEISQAGSELDMYNQAGCPLGGSSATTAPSDDCPAPSLSASSLEAGFSVSPVPFKDNLNIKYEFDYESTANIQIFDIGGNLVKSLSVPNAKAGVNTTINADFVRGQQMYIIKVTTDRDTFTKSVVSGK